jgi:hypothetical protein
MSQQSSLDSDRSSSSIHLGILPRDSMHVPASGYQYPEKLGSVGKLVGTVALGSESAAPPPQRTSGLFKRLLAASRSGVELKKFQDK